MVNRIDTIGGQAEAIDRLFDRRIAVAVGECVAVTPDYSEASVELIPDYNEGLGTQLDNCTVKQERWGSDHATFSGVTVRRYATDENGARIQDSAGRDIIEYPGDIGIVYIFGSFDGLKIVDFGVRPVGPAAPNYLQIFMDNLGGNTLTYPMSARFVRPTEHSASVGSAGGQVPVVYRDIVTGILAGGLRSLIRQRPDIIMYGTTQPTNAGDSDILELVDEFIESPLPVLNRYNLGSDEGKWDGIGNIRLMSNWVATTLKSIALSDSGGTAIAYQPDFDRFRLDYAYLQSLTTQTVALTIESEPTVDSVTVRVVPTRKEDYPASLPAPTRLTRTGNIWTSSALPLAIYPQTILISVSVRNMVETTYQITLPRRSS